MFGLALLVGPLSPDSAHAQDQTANEDRAKELYGNGVILYEEGQYEDAIAAWQEAYRLSNKALLLYNIANAYERLGELQEALDNLNRYRAFAPADEKEALDRRMRNIERRMQDAAVAAPPVVVTRPDEPDTVATTPIATGGNGVGTFPIVLIGTGTAATGAGVVFGIGALSARRDARALCTDSGAGTFCPDAASQAISRDATQSILADVSIGVGVVCAGVGVALAVTGSGGKTSSLQATPGGVRFHGSF